LVNEPITNCQASICLPIVGTGNINADVGEIFKVFKLLQDFFKFEAEGVTTISQQSLHCIRKFSNVRANVLLVGFITTKRLKLEWFQMKSMLNHHLSGLLGLGSLSWVSFK
jgi:photosystem I P700 chlorophyll a apoprotein A1